MKIHKDNDIGLDAYIVDAVFTPRASVKKQRSVYSDLHPQQLLATCIDALIDRNMLQNPGRHPDYLIAAAYRRPTTRGPILLATLYSSQVWSWMCRLHLSICAAAQVWKASIWQSHESLPVSIN